MFHWTGKNSIKAHVSEARSVAGTCEERERNSVTSLFDLRLPTTHQLRDPSTRFDLLTLVPRHGVPRLSPSLVLPTSLEGLELRIWVRNQRSYFLRFSGTAWCAVSSPHLRHSPASFCRPAFSTSARTWRKTLAQPQSYFTSQVRYSTHRLISLCLHSPKFWVYKCTLQLNAL